MAIALNQPAIVRGAAVMLAVSIPVIVLALILEAFIDLDSSGPVPVLLYLAIVASAVAAGRIAGMGSRQTPLIHGATAAIAGYAVLAVLAVGRLLITGDDIAIVALISNGFICAFFGLCGGLLALRAHAEQTIIERGGPGPLGPSGGV